MHNAALMSLADDLAADRRISADEALRMRKEIFPDGVVTRQEADVMVALQDRVANTDEAWASAFVEAIVDHVLQSGVYPGHVDEGTVTWLIASFGHEGAAETELETVLKVLERAESAPESLSAFARQRVSAHVAGRAMNAADVALVRRCLYAAAGSGAVAVTEDEARWLFALDSECDGRANDEAWGDLFVKAMLNHLMGRRAPKLLEAESMAARQKWLHSPQKGAVAFLSSMFEGGFSAFRKKLNYNATEAFEAHYEAVNAEYEQDSKLTLVEMAWAVGMTKDDGKRTANETALLAALNELEPQA
jgi:hypothetical protein